MEHVEHQGVSVVLIGKINPAIFNPDWLLRQGVVSEDEALDAKVEVIHPEMTQFQIADLAFEVMPDKFSVLAMAEPFVRAADVVAEIFKVALAHTPLTALGINYFAHFRVRDWHQQKALGRALAPIEPWGAWGAQFESDDHQEVGGMISLTMQQSRPGDRAAGNIKAIVQPSVKIEAGQGVYVQINDHYESPLDGKPINFAELCLERMTPSLERSRKIVSQLSDYARTL